MTAEQQDPTPQPFDEHTRVVTAINVTDASIAHHNVELRRLWALRGSLGSRLEQLGTRSPAAPPQDPQGTSGPAPSAVELDEHIGRSAPLPIDKVRPDPRVGQQLLDRMAAAGITPEPETSPAPVELLPLGTVIDGDRKYEKVLLRTEDLPAETFVVWVNDGRIQETHLYPVSGKTPYMLCGFSGDPNGWWRPGPEDFDARFELCFACARYIPGARLNHG